jgi:Polyketide cyclase / dehydrase and lipid transport
MTRVELTIPVDVDAPADLVWHTVTDWPGQSEWVIGTRVEVEGGGEGRHLGARLRAFTGVGPLGFLDTMEIVEWDPPRCCLVRHTGKVVRGDGVFEVVELGPERSRFVWTELLDLPLGAVGRFGWPLVRPGFAAGVQLALRKMARLCERRYTAPR